MIFFKKCLKKQKKHIFYLHKTKKVYFCSLFGCPMV